MKIDPRITNGLAWAGVFLIVGVPAADWLSAQFMGSPDHATPQIAVIEPVDPVVPVPVEQRPDAPVATAPVVTPAPKSADVVDSFVQSGRPLPSYITGGDAPIAPPKTAASQPAAPAPKPVVTRPEVSTPVATTPVAPATDPVVVAALPPKLAPVPMPLSMRPRPVAPSQMVAPQAVIIPPSVVAPTAAITAADLEDWESGPLSEFLASRQRQGSGATVTPDYVPNGFFLDQDPNQPRNRVIARQVDRPRFFAN